MPSSYAIGEHFETFIRDQLETGRYSSASEVVRDALRLLEEREQVRRIHLEELRAKVKEGMESVATVPADEVFDRLTAKYQAMLKP